MSMCRSRKKIRDAKAAQELEVSERIGNWREKNGKQTISRTEVSRHNRKVVAGHIMLLLLLLRVLHLWCCSCRANLGLLQLAWRAE